MRRALITGITGQDGSYLAELLLSKGYEVSGMVRRSATPNTQNIAHILDHITLIEADLCDFNSVLSCIERCWPDEVYNLAAMSHVGTSFTQPSLTFDTNTIGVSNLIEAIKIADRSIKLYQASTSEMFGNTSGPLDENSPMHPRSPYGCSKLAAHHLVRSFREAGHFACSGILFNHESPRRGDNFVTRKITKGVAEIYLGKRDTIELGNIHARRDWGYAPDYVKAMWMMMQMSISDDFVVGTGISHSVEDVLDVAFCSVGIEDWQKYVTVSNKHERPTDIEELIANPKKAIWKLGWKAETSFEELIRMMVKADIEKEKENATKKRK